MASCFGASSQGTLTQLVSLGAMDMNCIKGKQSPSPFNENPGYQCFTQCDCKSSSSPIPGMMVCDVADENGPNKIPCATGLAPTPGLFPLSFFIGYDAANKPVYVVEDFPHNQSKSCNSTECMAFMCDDPKLSPEFKANHCFNI